MNRIIEEGTFSLAKPGKRCNEDFFLAPVYDDANGIVFAIADGVGSLDGAVNASESVIKTIKKSLIDNSFSIEKALHQAKEDLELLAKNNTELSNSATTLTIVYLSDTTLSIGHVGDCRAYITQQNKLNQLTKDHTKYQEFVDSGEYSIHKLRSHKDKLSTVITKAISNTVKLEYDLNSWDINQFISNDSKSLIFTLMSDGAYAHWHKNPKFSTNTMNSPLAFVSSLKKRVQKNSSASDDYTCISVKIEIAQ